MYDLPCIESESRKRAEHSAFLWCREYDRGLSIHSACKVDGLYGDSTAYSDGGGTEFW